MKYKQLLYIIHSKNKSNDIDYTSEIINIIIPTFSQDLIPLMEYTNFKYKAQAKAIYVRHSHQNLHKYITTSNNFKNIVYTFS